MNQSRRIPAWLNSTLPGKKPTNPQSREMNPAPMTNVEIGINARLTTSDPGVNSPKNWMPEIVLTSEEARPIPSAPSKPRHAPLVHRWYHRQVDSGNAVNKGHRA